MLSPLIAALTLVARLLLRLLTRGRPAPGPFVTEDELKLILAMGEREGVVEQEERQMIDGILEMTDKPVHEVMVPRVDVVGIEAGRSLTDLIALIVDHGHSRIPVYETTIDNVVGVVYAKDLLRHGVRSGDPRPLAALAREPYFTPESKHVGELLAGDAGAQGAHRRRGRRARRHRRDRHLRGPHRGDRRARSATSTTSPSRRRSSSSAITRWW